GGEPVHRDQVLPGGPAGFRPGESARGARPALPVAGRRVPPHAARQCRGGRLPPRRGDSVVRGRVGGPTGPGGAGPRPARPRPCPRPVPPTGPPAGGGVLPAGAAAAGPRTDAGPGGAAAVPARAALP